MGLRSGDRVRVKDLAEITQTLDGNRCFEGLLFVPEMESHCGQEYVVLKKVRRIVDYYNEGTRRLRDTYILDGVHCHGSEPYPNCDRTCFYFWKGAWLEKTNDTAPR